MTCSQCQHHWCWICGHCRKDYARYAHGCKPWNVSTFTFGFNGPIALFVGAFFVLVLLSWFAQQIVSKIFCYLINLIWNWSTCTTILPRIGMTPLSWLWYLISGICRLIEIIICKICFVNTETYYFIYILHDFIVNTLIPYGFLQIWLSLYGVIDLILGKVFQIIWSLRYVWIRLLYFPLYSIFGAQYRRTYQMTIYGYFWTLALIIEGLIYWFLPFASLFSVLMFLYDYFRFLFRIISILFTILSIILWCYVKWRKSTGKIPRKEGPISIPTICVLISFISAVVSYYLFPLFPQAAV